MFKLEDYKSFIHIDCRSDSVQDFLFHVISKIDEYDEERFIKEYKELPPKEKRGRGHSRGRSPAKLEWKIIQKYI